MTLKFYYFYSWSALAAVLFNALRSRIQYFSVESLAFAGNLNRHDCVSQCPILEKIGEG